MSLHRSALLLLLLAAVVLACERPLAEPDAPAVEVVEPTDLAEVRSEPLLPVAVRARSFSSVDRVEIDGQPMTYDADAGLWRDTLVLWQRVNSFHVEAYSSSQARRDTLHVAYVPRVLDRTGPALPAPRGGHSTTRLADGRLLVAGGAQAAGRPASGAAYISNGSSAFALLATGLSTARTGHTATRLADGRVLFLGGSRSDAVDGVSDLVATAELFDPATSTFADVPVDGDPPLRTLHTALLHQRDGQTFIDVYGGLGAAAFSSEPRLVPRDDLRTFTLRNDSLIDLSGPLGPALLFDEDDGQPLTPYGHTQTPLLSNQTRTAPSLIAGMQFDGEEPLGGIVDLSRTPITARRVRAPFVTPRRRHASVLLAPNVVLHLGGQPPDAAAVPSELYTAQADAAFAFPPSRYRDIFIERYAHTATNWTANRILVVGGFSPSGTGIAASSWIDILITP